MSLSPTIDANKAKNNRSRVLSAPTKQMREKLRAIVEEEMSSLLWPLTLELHSIDQCSPPRRRLSPSVPVGSSSLICRIGRLHVDDLERRNSKELPATSAIENGYREPFVIGVAGGAASGKTTVCDMIIEQLRDQRVVLVNQGRERWGRKKKETEEGRRGRWRRKILVVVEEQTHGQQCAAGSGGGRGEGRKVVDDKEKKKKKKRTRVVNSRQQTCR
ncbi:hypothetical protein C4D60_Mb01t30560 [Musa balbisiana]|uniref:Phosphoribulokinase/uridine kinase domain-containing protein n=1 Tax=Musa balbisiana TaxID=52838 RepID=A0A4S8JRW4_MUSBA|nr:hypothetical protein C4D60_Mb01t30560 [Musa balbisiana]